MSDNRKEAKMLIAHLCHPKYPNTTTPHYIASERGEADTVTNVDDTVTLAYESVITGSNDNDVTLLPAWLIANTRRAGVALPVLEGALVSTPVELSLSRYISLQQTHTEKSLVPD
ncbi:hypothetical protein CBL_01949 [Carabus blaptoides fortunei]